MIQQGLLEYIFTIGIILSIVALIIGAVKDRKNIRETLGKHGFKRRDFLIIIAILLVFAFLELYFVKPTQLLFFDDAIYQGMALDLIHMGQAWMCNYGTPTTCFSGQVYHEPIGLSFNIAIGFLIGGVNKTSAHAAEMALGFISIFASFFVALLLLKNKSAAYFTALLVAVSPVLLVWAMPTNSDLAVLAYSLISVFFFLAFMKKKTLWSFSNMLFAFSLLLYMKVDEIFFIPIFIVLYFVLEEKGIRKAFSDTLKHIKNNFLNTKFLIILLFFVFAVAPSILYAFNESATDGYGYQGTVIQNTCTQALLPVNVTAEFSIQNFKANICSNIAFWFNNYKNIYIMQPIVFTIIAIIGAALMIIIAKQRRALVAVALWFFVFFFLYAFFYAGSVNYGVDWRFMLSLIAQVCILGGFCLGLLFDRASEYAGKRFGRKKLFSVVILAAILILVFYPIYALLPQLSVNPSQIQQAGDARFYEGFVYNTSNMIPANCIVYTYDPTLFNINNRTATQIDNLYNTTQVAEYQNQYQCLVLDYGYWCHTPNSECTAANNTYNLTKIINATYEPEGYGYGYYLVKDKV
jgi:4-amino-4-deoxy-L-arabinose transferase-like glycosyltransferase